MERNEKDRIRENLTRLIQYTICDKGFLVYFHEKKILSKENVEIIIKQQLNCDRAYEFYSIIQTRKDAFRILLHALEETDQSGVIDLLTGKEKLISSKLPQSNIEFGVTSPVTQFTGRKDELDRILQSKENQSSKKPFFTHTCVSGLGGIGKSQLVRKYIQEYGANFKNRIWFDASSEKTLLKEFGKLAAERLDIKTVDANGKEKSITCIATDVFNYFKDDTVLLVFDDADKKPWFDDILTKSTKNTNVYVIITSRIREWYKTTDILNLSTLLEKDAILLIKQGLKIQNEDQYARNLADRLQFLPLAIQQAISYINDQQIMLENYCIESYLADLKIESMKKKLLSFIVNDDHYNDYRSSIFNTWNKSIEKIHQEEESSGELALQLLHLMSYLENKENIMREMFYEFPDIFETISDSAINGAVRILINHSMINGENGQSVLSIHRLVQDVRKIKSYSRREQDGIEIFLSKLIAEHLS